MFKWPKLTPSLATSWCHRDPILVRFLLTSHLTSRSFNSTQGPGVAGLSGIVWLPSGRSRSWSARAARADGWGLHCNGIPWTCKNLGCRGHHISLTLHRYFAQFSLFAQLNSTNTSVGIITNSPFGNPVNFRMRLDKNLSQSTDEGVYLRLDVRRSIAVRLLVMFIVLANCTSTTYCD